LAAVVATCTATDSAGNTGSASFIVKVTSSPDSSLPRVIVPSDMTLDGGTTDYAILEYSVKAIDDVDGAITPTCNLSSGSLLSVGEWTVACTAIDSAGNIGYNRFMVTVTPGSDTPTPEPVIEVTEEVDTPEAVEVEHDPVPIPNPPPSAPAETDIKISLGSGVPGCELSNSCFYPSSLFVDVGETITWYNADTAAHTVTSGTGADGSDGVFDSSLFMAGATFSHSFEEAGTYDYFCMVHPWMVGEVVVQGSGTISDTTPPQVIVPSDMTIDAGTAGFVKLEYDVKAIDDVDGAITPTCDIGSGTVLSVEKLAAVVVTCSATDSAGNTGSDSFIVSVTSEPDIRLHVAGITPSTSSIALTSYSSIA